MPCSISCMLSAIFLIGMIYFYIKTYNNKIVRNYVDTLNPTLKQRYEKIRDERLKISIKGYILGFILACIIIMSNKKLNKLSNLSLVCIVISVCFLTNYFYYMIHPKSDWMLDDITDEQQIKNWLEMYREMSYNYHMGLVLGIIAVGVFSYGFRC